MGFQIHFAIEFNEIFVTYANYIYFAKIITPADIVNYCNYLLYIKNNALNPPLCTSHSTLSSSTSNSHNFNARDDMKSHESNSGDFRQRTYPGSTMDERGKFSFNNLFH